MKFIGFGGWVYYYYYLLAATLTKVVKEDIFGFGNTCQIIMDLIISKHKFLPLFLNYFSEFFFGLIFCLFLAYFEKRDIKKKEKYEKMENGDISEINKNENNKKVKKHKKQEMELISKGKEIDTITNTMNDELINDDDRVDNVDRVTAHLALIIDKKIKDIKDIKINKKEDNNNQNNISDNSQMVPKNLELIHNNMYEDITESSIYSIILSSFLLIVNDVVIRWLFTQNEIFDYFFFNILIMTFIYKFHFKEQIYNHQTLSLIIILVIAGASFIACLFEKIEINKKNITIWEIFEERRYLVFVFIAIYFVSSFFACYGIIIQKRIMDYKFTSPYKIIFLRGLFGIIISAIIITLTTCFPCKDDNNVNLEVSIIDNFFFLNNKSDSNNTENNNTNTNPPFFVCTDEYNNNTYFDNILSYFNSLIESDDKYLELCLYIPLYCILTFATNIFLILLNKSLSPFHCLIVDSLYRLLDITIKSIKDLTNDYITSNSIYEYITKYSSTSKILKITAYFISLIGYFIYLEIIELKFCGLNKNIIKNIRKRAKKDGKHESEISSNRSESNTSNFSSEEEEDDKSSKKKNK